MPENCEKKLLMAESVSSCSEKKSGGRIHKFKGGFGMLEFWELEEYRMGFYYLN
jgi:hypothetical protein